PMATSTLYGTGTGGQVLGWSNVTGGLAFIATSTNALTATTLQTARTINGVSFNGSANIVVASTTLLGDTNTWTNTQAMSISGNAATVTNGVYTTTFNNLFDNRLSASSSISGITTLPNLSITKSQVSDFGTYEAPLTFNAPILRSGNTISYVGLATTSQPSSSNLLVSNGTSGVYGVATSTLTAGTGLTGSFTQLGSGGSLAINSNGVTYALMQQVNANRLLGNPTGAAANASEIATTTLFGTPTQGTILAFLNGQNSWQSTTTMNIGGNAANVTGTVALANGGTGLTSVTGNRLLYSNSDGSALAQVATSSLNIGGNAATVTTNANMSGAVTSSGSNVTAFGSQSAGVLATAVTGVPAFTATSTLYGTGTGGRVLGWDNTTGGLAFVATSTNALTATALQNARTINGISFNGTANITIASTTLLGDSNTWSGNNTFSNTPVLAALSGLIGGNSGS
ncbi:MAG: hypothetical protein AAB794_00525, partial [Patescibacteria group bacterium]